MFKRSRELDEVFDACLERVASGAGIEESVEEYPEYRDELVPMLQTASATMQVASSITYRPEAKTRGLQRLTAAIGEKQRRERDRFPWLSWLLGRRPRLARPLVAGVAAAVLVSGTAFGATVASEDSVPGEPLYWVKTTKEDISLKMPKSDTARAREHARLATVRGEEMQTLMGRGNYDHVEVLVVRMNGHLNETAVLIGVTIPTNQIESPPRPPRRQREAVEITRYLQQEQALFDSLFEAEMQFAVQSERARMRQMMRRSELMFRSFIAAMESSGPAPWPWMTEPPRPRLH